MLPKARNVALSIVIAFIFASFIHFIYSQWLLQAVLASLLTIVIVFIIFCFIHFLIQLINGIGQSVAPSFFDDRGELDAKYTQILEDIIIKSPSLNNPRLAQGLRDRLVKYPLLGRNVNSVVECCIVEISKAAGRERLFNRRFYSLNYDEWSRTGSPELVRLDKYLNGHITAEKARQIAESRNNDAIENKSKERRIMKIYTGLHHELVQQFLQITFRKVSLRDEYGDEHWEFLKPEVCVVLRKMIQRDSAYDGPADSIVKCLKDGSPIMDWDGHDSFMGYPSYILSQYKEVLCDMYKGTSKNQQGT